MGNGQVENSNKKQLKTKDKNIGNYDEDGADFDMKRSTIGRRITQTVFKSFQGHNESPQINKKSNMSLNNSKMNAKLQQQSTKNLGQSQKNSQQIGLKFTQKLNDSSEDSEDYKDNNKPSNRNDYKPSDSSIMNSNNQLKRSPSKNLFKKQSIDAHPQATNNQQSMNQQTKSPTESSSSSDQSQQQDRHNVNQSQRNIKRLIGTFIKSESVLVNQDNQDDDAYKKKPKSLINLDEIDANDSIDTNYDVGDVHNNKHQIWKNADAIDQPNDQGKGNPVNRISKTFKRLYVRTIISKITNKPGEDKQYKFNIIEQDKDEFNTKRILPSKDQLFDIGIAAYSIKGNIEDFPNQDDYLLYIDSQTRIYGVFDGHGAFGHHISNLTYRFIFKNMFKSVTFFADPFPVLKRIFANINQYIEDYINYFDLENSYNTIMSGCSGVIVIHRGQTLHIANIGDTRAVIFRQTNYIPKKQKPYLQITNSHIPIDQAEHDRVYQNGGEIKKWKTDFLNRVFVRGRNYPGLHITRCIGNQVAHEIGVITEADLKKYEVQKQQDLFLLIGSQSVFEFLDCEEISMMLSAFSFESVRDASEVLQKRIRSAWLQNENCFDDYTFMLIYF